MKLVQRPALPTQQCALRALLPIALTAGPGVIPTDLATVAEEPQG
jgi:hypothetical protein